jgi:hypothetical protein
MLVGRFHLSKSAARGDEGGCERCVATTPVWTSLRTAFTSLKQAAIRFVTR